VGRIEKWLLGDEGGLAVGSCGVEGKDLVKMEVKIFARLD